MIDGYRLLKDDPVMRAAVERMAGVRIVFREEQDMDEHQDEVEQQEQPVNQVVVTVETASGMEPDCPDTPGGYQRSAAISLKRIADAMTNKGGGSGGPPA